MNDGQMNMVAKQLVGAWQNGEPLSAMPEHWPPVDRAQAYAMQDCFAKHTSQRVAGWKLGLSAQKLVGSSGYHGPIPGRIFATRVYQNGAELPAQLFVGAKAEAELAFRIGRDFPARARGYRFADMQDDLAMLPCIEMVRPNAPIALAVENCDQLIADNSACVGVVLGDDIANWQSLDCDNHKISMMVNDDGPKDPLVGQDRASPARTLEDLMVILGERNIDLMAGQIVTTGTTNIPQLLGTGDDVAIDYGSAGMMRFRIAGV